jgi:hypothetical protein
MVELVILTLLPLKYQLVHSNRHKIPVNYKMNNLQRLGTQSDVTI